MMLEDNGNQFINLEEFKRSVKNEKSLPQNMDNILLQRFLKVYNEIDLNKSMELLKFNLKLRKSGPQLFTNRDPLADDIQRASRTAMFCPMPKLMENYKITIISLINDDASQFDYLYVVKMVMMMLDARFTEYDAPSKTISDGECFIIDSKGTSIRHFFNMVKNVATVRLYMKYIQEAAPFKIRKIHFINCSYIVDKMFALIRPLLHKELLNVIFFHTRGLESLYEHVPRDFLPADLGGDLGSLSEIYTQFLEFVFSKREYLLNEDNWKITE